MLSGWGSSFLLRRHPSAKGTLERRGGGFRSPLLGLGGRYRRPGEPRARFRSGLLRPAATIAVAAFVLLDLILVYGLIANDSPAPTMGESGAYKAIGESDDDLPEALRDLGMTKVNSLTLFGKDAPPDTRHSTKGTGGNTSSETSSAGGSTTDSGTGGSDSGSSGGSTDEGDPGWTGDGGGSGGGWTGDGGWSGGGGGG